jgi:SAM-dependent methyltransferase
MSDPKPKTSTQNGRLWGARARDWAELAERQTRPAYEAVLGRANVGAGTVYLDVGCGAGLAAQLAAERGARVSGLDASEPLLAIARERVPEGDFRLGDLEDLPFEDDRFDVVSGFNSFQFAGNPERALSEAKRVARSGGLVVILTWGPPEGMEAASVLAALKPLAPPPSPGAPGPFALSDETALRAFATAAVLEPAEVFDIERPWIDPDLDTALRGLNSSGVAARAIESSGEEAVTRAWSEALAPFRQADGGYRVEATFRCLFARA